MGVSIAFKEKAVGFYLEGMAVTGSYMSSSTSRANGSCATGSRQGGTPTLPNVGNKKVCSTAEMNLFCRRVTRIEVIKTVKALQRLAVAENAGLLRDLSYMREAGNCRF